VVKIQYLQDPKTGHMVGSVAGKKVDLTVATLPDGVEPPAAPVERVELDELFAHYQETHRAEPAEAGTALAWFACPRCSAENELTVSTGEGGRFEAVCQNCSAYTYSGSLVQPFEADGPTQIHDEAIAELSDQIAALDTLDEDATVRVGDLDVKDTWTWTANDILSRQEAIDLLRYNKALHRAELTRIATEAEGANHTLAAYGDSPLGNAVAVGTYEPGTVAWLLNRTAGIGGSDKIGHIDADGAFHPYDGGELRFMLESKSSRTVERLASMSATPDAIAQETELPAEIGNVLERTIQREFALNNPEYRHLEDKSSRIAAGRPHHRFNPDGVLQEVESGKYGIFEAKTARDAATFERALSGYRAQCLHNAAAADLDFAVLVADVEGESRQRTYRMNFTAEERAAYRRQLDKVWLWVKPEYDRRSGNFR
jgi:hypothetical protein